jgi:2-methylcitrate dehydratase PrpD
LSGPAGPLPPALSAFMSRIQVRAEEGLLAAGYPQAWPAPVTVTASARRERTVTHVPGDPARPFGEDDLEAKFVRVTAAVLGGDRAASEFAAALTALERPAAFINQMARIPSGE